MESEQQDAARIVEELSKEDETNLVREGDEYKAASVGDSSSISSRMSSDAQYNFEVVQSPGHEERSINDDNGGSLVVVDEQPSEPTRKVIDETPTPRSKVSSRDVSPRPGSAAGEVQTSLIQVQLQIDASMDNDELEAVRQTMTFILGFYRKWHEEHYHRSKTALDYGRAAARVTEAPKNDECLPEFHARVEGVATTYASRLAEVALEIQPALLAKAAFAYQKYAAALATGGDERSEEEIWSEFRAQAESLFLVGESWETFVVVMVLAYLVCLSEEVRTRQQRATNFLRSFIQYLVAQRRIRWVARHGGWANAAWGLRRQRLAKCLCAKSTLYGFVLISIGVAAIGIFLTKKQQRH